MQMSTSLLDLIEIWEIRQQTSGFNYLLNMMSDGELDARINKPTLSDSIVAACGGMVTRYNDSATFYRMGVSWFKSRKEQITHLLDALFSEYKPLEEFRYNEKEVLDGRKKTDNVTDGTLKESVQNNGGATDDFNGNQITTESVSAENESSFQPRNQTTTTTTNTNTNVHNDTTGTDSTTKQTLDGLEKRDDTITREHYGHKTSSQELALKEFEVAQENVYDIICAWFMDALMLGVY